MDINDGTDLAALHQAITAQSAVAFPGVHFEFYREDRRNLPLGSGEDGQSPKAYALLELTEMEDSDSDPGTEQCELMARFRAEFVIKSLQADSKTLVRVLAGSYAAFLRKTVRWSGVIAGGIKVMGVFKDDFSAELDQYEVWTVEWSQAVFLGEGVWKETGVAPNLILYSFVPLVGIPYEPDYKDITGAPRTDA